MRHNSKLYRYLDPAESLKKKVGINFKESINKDMYSNRKNWKNFESSKIRAGHN